MVLEFIFWFMMKRLHFLLILLFIVIWWVFYVYQNTQPISDNLPTPPNVLTGQQNNDSILSWETTTGSIVSWSVVSGNVDDTELPLDQQEGNDSESENSAHQESDPEVDEIINILEELIAESETENN